jgi:hypothetical protein
MQERITKDELFSKVEAEMKKQVKAVKKVTRKGDWTAKVDFGNKQGFEGNLESLYDEINTGVDIDAAVQSRVRVFAEVFSRMEKANKKVWSKKEVFERAALQAKPTAWLKSEVQEKAQTYHKPLVAGLSATIVIDFPEYCAYLTRAMLKEMNISEEEIEQKAMENNINRKYDVIADSKETKEIGGRKATLLLNRGEPTIYNLICTPKRIIDYTKGKEYLAVIPFRDMLVMVEKTDCIQENMEAFMYLWMLSKRMIADKINAYPLSEKPFVIHENGSLGKYDFDGIPGDGAVMAMEIDRKTGKKKVSGILEIENDGA